MLQRRGFRPQRARGQTFLRDQGTILQVVRAIHPCPGDTILEIGAGAGEITLPLAATAGRLLAVESEPALFERLKQNLAQQSNRQAEALHLDFLKVNMPELFSSRGLERVRVVGNLPYALASPILMKLLVVRDLLADLTLMFQQEVAERLAARPGTKAYGFLSVVTQQAARVEVLLRIPPQAFWPRPKVHSALVRLNFKGESEPSVANPALFRSLVKALLAHRRKNIANNIKYLKSRRPGASAVLNGLKFLDIDPKRRAESLTVEEFAALAEFCSSRQ